MPFLTHGINIPWPFVLAAIIVGLVWSARQTVGWMRPSRGAVAVLGTASLLLGVATFSLLLVTVGPLSAFAAAAETKPPVELESPIGTAPFTVDRSLRPNWVVDAPEQAKQEFEVALSSGPWATQAECDRALDTKLKAATDEFISDHLRSELAPRLLRYDLSYIKKHLVQPSDIYHETITVSFGPMKQTHARLKFDSSFRQELETRWRQVVAGSRLGQTGLLFGGMLAFLAAFFSYVKLDTATRGFYTGRLQLAVAATILLIVAAGISVALWIPWL